MEGINLIYLRVNGKSEAIPAYSDSISRCETINNLIKKIQEDKTDKETEAKLFLAICHKQECRGLFQYFVKRYQKGKKDFKKAFEQRIEKIDVIYLTRNPGGNNLVIGKAKPEMTISAINLNIMWPLTGSFLAICPHGETNKLIKYFKEKYWNWEIKRTIREDISNCP